MLFLVALLIATLTSALVAAALGKGRDLQRDARLGLGIAIAIAGIAHLANPTPFEQHLPEWTPAIALLVLVSGLFEIALGAALVVPWFDRQTVGRVAALFFVAVWPANIYVAVYDVAVDGQPGGPYPWLRVPFQVVFIVWALWSTRPRLNG